MSRRFTCTQTSTCAHVVLWTEKKEIFERKGKRLITMTTTVGGGGDGGNNKMLSAHTKWQNESHGESVHGALLLEEKWRKKKVWLFNIKWCTHTHALEHRSKTINDFCMIQYHVPVAIGPAPAPDTCEVIEHDEDSKKCDKMKNRKCERKCGRKKSHS